MTDKEVMQMALDTFNKSKRSHYYCEDRFYSCPQHEEGCADALEGDECNCGANFVNETIDKAIEALRAALAHPEPEPVAWMYDWTTSDGEFIQDWTTSEAETLRDTKPNIISNIRPLYTAQREWVGLTDDEIQAIHCQIKVKGMGSYKTEGIYRAIEAKLKEKNT